MESFAVKDGIVNVFCLLSHAACVGTTEICCYLKQLQIVHNASMVKFQQKRINPYIKLTSQ